MGRKETPTKLKILRGNPGRRPINESEPDSPLINPEPPEWLNEGGREFWEECCSVLVPMRHVTEADRAALGTLAMALAELKNAREKMDSVGRTVTFETGAEQVSPYVTIFFKAMTHVKALLCEFGMTPSSRSRIVAKAKGEKEDPFEKFMSRGKKKAG